MQHLTVHIIMDGDPLHQSKRVAAAAKNGRAYLLLKLMAGCGGYITLTKSLLKTDRRRS